MAVVLALGVAAVVDSGEGNGAVLVARAVARAVTRAVVEGSSFLTNYEKVFILVKLSFLLSPTSKPTTSFSTMCFFVVLPISSRRKPTTSFAMMCFF